MGPFLLRIFYDSPSPGLGENLMRTDSLTELYSWRILKIKIQ